MIDPQGPPTAPPPEQDPGAGMARGQMNERLRKVAGALGKRLVTSSKDARKRFLDEGREIMRYGYAPDHQFEYQAKAPKAFFKARVSLTAEAFAVFGPYLFPQVPVRIVQARPWAPPEAVRRSEIINQYLNYTASETGFRDEARRAIIEAIGYGRGVLWVGRDARTGLMTGTYDSVRNFGTDPDAQTPRERRYVWRRRVRPRFEVLREFPAAREVILAEPRSERRESDNDSAYDWEKTDSAAECITYYELYLNTGIHNFTGGSELVKLAAEAAGVAFDARDPSRTVQLDDGPRKYCILESGALLAASEWEIPFFEDGLFPCNELDLLDNPDSDWPVSPLAAGLGFQRAANWIITLMMGKYRFTQKTIGALARNGHGVPEKDREKLLRIGNDIDFISIMVNGETKTLNQYVQEFNWSHEYLVHGMRFFELMEQRYQKATGLYDILYAGEVPRQMRSAQEAAMKERFSRSRIDDMRDRVAEWMKQQARMEALGARFLHSGEEIAALFGPEAGRDWGFLVRAEAKDAESWFAQYVQSGMDPQLAMQTVQEQMQRAVSLDDWRAELDYTIEAGSMRRHDYEARVDALREMVQQVVPGQLGAPDPFERAMGYETLAEYYFQTGGPSALVDGYRQMAARLRQAPPAPAPAPAPGPMDGAPIPGPRALPPEAPPGPMGMPL
jgi:hypothetical protein